MTSTTERNWTEPIGELSMAWAHEITKQIPDDYEVSVKPYTTLELPPGRCGAMVSYHEYKDGRTVESGMVKILTHVAVCVRHDGQREITVQVYSSTSSGTGGLTRRWLAPAKDAWQADGYTEALLEAIGAWAFAKRLEIAAMIG